MMSVPRHIFSPGMTFALEIEAIMDVELTAEEQAAVQVSAEAVHKSIASLGL